MNKTFKILTFIACFVLCASNSHALFSKWKTISPKGGNFSIKMPGKPKYSLKDDKTPVGYIGEHIYNYETKDTTLTAEYQDLPGIALILGDNEVYKKSAKAFLKDTKGKQISFNKIEVASYKGKDLQYVTPTRFGYVRFLLVNDRLYVLQASFKKPDKGVEVMKKYFESFKPRATKTTKKRTNKYHKGK